MAYDLSGELRTLLTTSDTTAESLFNRLYGRSMALNNNIQTYGRPNPGRIHNHVRANKRCVIIGHPHGIVHLKLHGYDVVLGWFWVTNSQEITIPAVLKHIGHRHTSKSQSPILTLEQLQWIMQYFIVPEDQSCTT